MHDIVCSNCGQPGQVPFAPRTDRPVYCSNCFEARRRPAAPAPTPTA
jgi:CxxC-x17-CxxC domain-containing protein